MRLTDMSAPQEIIALTEWFERNRAARTFGQYNETQLRREFLDPFFKALGGPPHSHTFI
jgi:hypothetical protein